MVNKFKFSLLFSLFLFVFTSQVKGQVKAGDFVDGVVAVIGDEVVLESDLEEQKHYAQQQGVGKLDDCDFLESLMNNKLLVFEAKRDTLIEDRKSMIKENAALKYNQIMSQFPDEKTMLETYKFRTPYEMKSTIEKIDVDNYYSQAKYGRITESADITPNEVTNFFNKYQYELPEVKDEVTLSNIVMYPKLTEAHKQEIIDKLMKIKQDILAGESFESQARIYSEDPGSASNGGLYNNVPKGQMVKPFEAAALNLQEGEMSNAVESEFGFHLIQLVKKSGKIYDVRHILLKAEPNEDEIKTAKKELDSIRGLLKDGKMTFKEAAFRYSDDKATKFNAGLMTSKQDGSARLEKMGLAASVAYQIAGVEKGDLTDVFEDTMNDRKVVRLIKVDDIMPSHRISIDSDYDRIKEYALKEKKNNMVTKWVSEKVPSVFIQLNDKYKACNFKSKWIK